MAKRKEQSQEKPVFDMEERAAALEDALSFFLDAAWYTNAEGEQECIFRLSNEALEGLRRLRDG